MLKVKLTHFMYCSSYQLDHPQHNKQLGLYSVGLPSHTDFEVTVAALSDSGRGPYSAPVFIKTLESSKLTHMAINYCG